MTNKKILSAMTVLFLIYIVISAVQANFWAEKELLLTVAEIKKYCDFNSVLTHCVSAIDLKNAVNTDYSGKISVFVNSSLFVPFQYLKYILLFANIALFGIFLRKKELTVVCKIPFGLIILFSLLASYKFIYLYTNNIVSIPFYFASGVILFTCLVFILFYYSVKYLTKNANFSVLFTLYFSLLIYYTNYVNITTIQLFNIGFALILLLNSESVIKFLKPFTVSLLCLCVINGGYNFITKYNFHSYKNMLAAYKATKDPKSNIYIFLFDMYGGSESLEKIYGFDNSPFVNKLKKQGFYVNDNINSNYNATILTIPSCLNFEYLDNIKYDTASDAISYSELFKIAKQLSYKIYYFNSILGTKIFNDIIDFSYSAENEVYLSANLFLNNTIFNSYAKKYLLDKKTINVVFNTFYNIVKNENSYKKLLFFHFLMPHDPFLYNEDGTSANVNENDHSSEGDKWFINQEKYIQYLKYTNKRIIELAEFIKENDKNNPIIVIFGDHGFRSPLFVQHQTHMKEMDSYYYLSHFNTFLAYYNNNSDFSSYKNTNDLLNFYINFSNEVFGTDMKNLKYRKIYSDIGGKPIIKFSNAELIEVE